MSFTKSRFYKPTLIGLSLLVLVGIWWLSSYFIDTPYILPYPHKVFVSFCKLLITPDFWSSLGTSFLSIYAGFFVGMIIGILVGILTWYSRSVDVVLSPVFSIIRTMPVACFIILAWTLLGRNMLSFFISLLMTAPVMMTATQIGLRATSKDLLETADIYKLSWLKKIHTCYLPATAPHVISGTVNCIGLAWKAGIAAEIITTIDGTIGNEIWEAKTWDTDASRLFAWTIAIILISLSMEWLFKWVTRRVKGVGHA